MVEYYIMKKWKLFISALLFTSVVLVSCATTSSDNTSEKKHTNSKQAAAPAAPELSAEELYLQDLNTFTLSFTKVPGKIRKGNEFDSAYEVTVLNKDGQPAADFDVCFLYPSKNEGSQFVYRSTVIKTDENGIAALKIGKVDFAAKTTVTAYPNIEIDLTKEYYVFPVPMITADFIVESDVALKGAIMFVFEYNENGKSPKNSYSILSGLRKKGVSQIGNAPISDTSYINASKETIYKENYAYIEDQLDMFGYLIGGTIKFVNPVEKNEDGTYTAHMVADLYGIEMKTGKVIYEGKIENTGSGTNWNKAVDSCSTKLTELAVDSIMFGL